MSLNHSEENSHPEELLEAYSLDALDDDEAELVEVHLEGCAQCQITLGRLLDSTTALASSVGQQAPPADLRSRIMAGLPSQPIEPAIQHHTAASTTHSRSLTSPWLLPIAASLVIGLFSMSLVMNLSVNNRVDHLTSQNSTITAQLGQTVAQTQQLQQQNALLTYQINKTEAHEIDMLSSLQRMQVATYLSVYPNTQPLLLEPPNGSENPQGVLLVDDRGQRAVLMVSNMEDPSRLRSYRVWLVRNGVRIPAGTVQVDETGWGTLDLKPPEPMSAFDWVNLTVDDQNGAIPNGEKMVLRSRIP